MGVAVPDEIRRYGEIFRGIPEMVPPVRPETMLGPDGPLSGGLAARQNLKANAAADFGRTKDAGIITAGDGLLRISANFGEFDGQNAEAIRRVFADPAPDTGGVR